MKIPTYGNPKNIPESKSLKAMYKPVNECSEGSNNRSLQRYDRATAQAGFIMIRRVELRCEGI